MTAGQAAVFAAALLTLLGGWALVRRYQRTQATFNYLTADETDHEARIAAPAETELLHTDGFTCLRCYENPALPDKIWCAVCTPVVDEYPSEPIERGAL